MTQTSSLKRPRHDDAGEEGFEEPALHEEGDLASQEAQPGLLHGWENFGRIRLYIDTYRLGFLWDYLCFI